MKEKRKDELPYCGTLVRMHDPDRFLQSMFFSHEVRTDLWALFAFNHEIAKTREVVSESTLGLIRLQWWRDSLEAIYAGRGMYDHDVLGPLAQAIERHTLPYQMFGGLLDARGRDLQDQTPADQGALLRYADETSTPVFELALRITGSVSHDKTLVQSVAIRYALAGILRASGFLGAQHRFYFPADRMVHHGVTKENFFDPQSCAKRAALARDVYDIRPSRISGLRDPFLRSAQALSTLYFWQIRRARYDVLSPGLSRDPPFKVLRVLMQTKMLS